MALPQTPQDFINFFRAHNPGSENLISDNEILSQYQEQARQRGVGDQFPQLMSWKPQQATVPQNTPTQPAYDPVAAAFAKAGITPAAGQASVYIESDPGTRTWRQAAAVMMRTPSTPTSTAFVMSEVGAIFCLLFSSLLVAVIVRYGVRRFANTSLSYWKSYYISLITDILGNAAALSIISIMWLCGLPREGTAIALLTAIPITGWLYGKFIHKDDGTPIQFRMGFKIAILRIIVISPAIVILCIITIIILISVKH